MKGLVYGFGFGKTNSGYTLYKIRNIDQCYLLYGASSINFYLELVLHDQPPFILGLGTYSGIDQDKIRIETLCTNQFRNIFIDGDTEAICEIQPFLQPHDSAKYTTAIGNSFCNFTSWKIMSLIESGKLHSQYTFLHIPRTMKPWIAAQIIDEMIASS